jgi:hypothetical protein
VAFQHTQETQDIIQNTLQTSIFGQGDGFYGKKQFTKEKYDPMKKAC